MSQPPSDQDRPPEQGQDQSPSWPAGKKPSIWPSGNEPPAWPSAGQAPSWPSRDQAPAWPSGPSQHQHQHQHQDQQPSWPSGDQPPAWPSPGQSPPPPDWRRAEQPPLSSPDYTYGYSPHRPRLGRRFPVRAVIVLALFIAFGFAVRGLTSHHQGASVASPTTSAGLHTGLQAPAGVIGASFSLDGGGGTSYQVTLVKVIDPARGADQFSTPDHGKRLVGLVFRITGVTGSPQGEDANNDAVLVGANGRDYAADLNGIAGYTDFDDGAIHVTPGQMVTGAVAFQVPASVTVSTVQWTALSGFGPMVEWNVQA
jgi:hypothetical protein